MPCAETSIGHDFQTTVCDCHAEQRHQLLRIHCDCHADSTPECAARKTLGNTTPSLRAKAAAARSGTRVMNSTARCQRVLCSADRRHDEPLDQPAVLDDARIDHEVRVPLRHRPGTGSNRRQ